MGATVCPVQAQIYGKVTVISKTNDNSKIPGYGPSRSPYSDRSSSCGDTEVDLGDVFDRNTSPDSSESGSSFDTVSTNTAYKRMDAVFERAADYPLATVFLLPNRQIYDLREAAYNAGIDTTVFPSDIKHPGSKQRYRWVAFSSDRTAVENLGYLGREMTSPYAQEHSVDSNIVEHMLTKSEEPKELPNARNMSGRIPGMDLLDDKTDRQATPPTNHSWFYSILSGTVGGLIVVAALGFLST